MKLFIFILLFNTVMFAQKNVTVDDLYKPTGKLDTLNVELVVSQPQTENTGVEQLVVIKAFAECEIYSFKGIEGMKPEREMKDKIVVKRYIDLNGKEIKSFIWNMRVLDNN